MINFEECNQLKLYKSEQELCAVLELISDKIEFKGYDIQEIVLLVKEMLEINILSLNYVAREQLLSTLCDAVSHYDIQKTINWDKLLMIKNKVEDDLKEYIEDFFV